MYYYTSPPKWANWQTTNRYGVVRFHEMEPRQSTFSAGWTSDGQTGVLFHMPTVEKIGDKWRTRDSAGYMHEWSYEPTLGESGSFGRGDKCIFVDDWETSKIKLGGEK